MSDTGEKYLKCLELLDFLLSDLKAGVRIQVEVNVLDNTMNGLSVINMTIPDDKNICRRITDIASAVDIFKKSGVKFLTETMKETVVNGLLELKTMVATEIYNYYSDNEFEPNDQTIPLFKEVVTIALETGLLKV